MIRSGPVRWQLRNSDRVGKRRGPLRSFDNRTCRQREWTAHVPRQRLRRAGSFGVRRLVAAFRRACSVRANRSGDKSPHSQDAPAAFRLKPDFLVQVSNLLFSGPKPRTERTGATTTKKAVLAALGLAAAAWTPAGAAEQNVGWRGDGTGKYPGRSADALGPRQRPGPGSALYGRQARAGRRRLANAGRRDPGVARVPAPCPSRKTPRSMRTAPDEPLARGGREDGRSDLEESDPRYGIPRFRPLDRQAGRRGGLRVQPCLRSCGRDVPHEPDLRRPAADLPRRQADAAIWTTLSLGPGTRLEPGPDEGLHGSSEATGVADWYVVPVLHARGTRQYRQTNIACAPRCRRCTGNLCLLARASPRR